MTKSQIEWIIDAKYDHYVTRIITAFKNLQDGRFPPLD